MNVLNKDLTWNEVASMRCSWSADFTWTMSVWSRSVIRISRISLLRGDLGDFYERMCEGNTRMMERIEMETKERSPRLSLLYIYIYLQKETNQRRATERGGQRERRGVTSWWHAVSRRGLCPLRDIRNNCKVTETKQDNFSSWHARTFSNDSLYHRRNT